MKTELCVLKIISTHRVAGEEALRKCHRNGKTGEARSMRERRRSIESCYLLCDCNLGCINNEMPLGGAASDPCKGPVVQVVQA
jgi:hypothetical protein